MSKQTKYINVPIPVQAKYTAEVAAKFKMISLRDWIGEGLYIASMQVLTNMGLKLDLIKQQYAEATGLEWDDNLFGQIEIEEVVQVEEAADPLLEEVDSEVV